MEAGNKFSLDNIDAFKALGDYGLYGQVFDGKKSDYHIGDRVKVYHTKPIREGLVLGESVNKKEGYIVLLDNGELDREVKPIHMGLIKKIAQANPGEQ